MKEYYQERILEYDQVYQKAERQANLRVLENYCSSSFHQESIIEIACGTGYWTQFLAQSAKDILAFDILEVSIQMAKQRNYQTGKPKFEVADFYTYEAPNRPYDSLFGAFIFSHILVEERLAFLKRCASWIKKGGKMVFIDNLFVKGSNTPIARKDQLENTFQNRKLSNGKAFEVLKNFPKEEEIQDLARDLKVNYQWTSLDYFWILELSSSG